MLLKHEETSLESDRNRIFVLTINLQSQQLLGF